MRTRTILVMLAACLMAGLGAPGVSGSGSEARYVVWGLSEAQLEDLDVDVVDEYASFVTADLTPAEADELTEAGATLERLAFRSGRGFHWRDYVANGDDDIPSNLRAPLTTSYWLVQYRGPIKESWREKLEDVGTIYDYVPENTLLTKLSATARLQVRSWSEVRGLVPYHPAFKLAVDATSGTVPVIVAVYPEASLSDARAKMADAGFVETSYARGLVDLVFLGTIHVSKLDDLARVALVTRIEPAPEAPALDNGPATSITQGGYAPGEPYAWPLNARGLDGSTQKVEVCDSGANTEGYDNATRQMRMVHEMFADANAPVVFNAHQPTFSQPTHRKLDLYFSPVDPTGLIGDHDDAIGHGTHVAGTIAGDAAPYGERGPNDGIAYGAKLIVCDIYVLGETRPLLDYSQMYQPAYDRGSRISSNSWGSGDSRAYTIITRQNDAFAYEHPEFLIVRSQGNTGMASMRVDAVAKNVVAVGATENVYVNGGAAGDPDNIYWISETLGSSWGPTLDGRIKPNLVAPGNCVISSDLPDASSYRCRSGTSMSTPQVAGAAALIRDYFAKGYYPTGAPVAANARNVSAALVRAILQVSSHEISGDRGEMAFPNGVQGWGRLALDTGLSFTDTGHRLRIVDEGPAMTTGLTRTATIRVERDGEPLRIMLAWRDAPATGCVIPALCDAQPNLVNDLDLVVVGPGGAIHKGNAFVGGQTPANPLAPRDGRNVEEAVYLDSAPAGTYTVKVVGWNVATGSSTYALAMTGVIA